MGALPIVLLILAMKIPIFGLIWPVWWAGRAPASPGEAEGAVVESPPLRPLSPRPPRPRRRGRTEVRPSPRHPVTAGDHMPRGARSAGPASHRRPATWAGDADLKEFPAWWRASTRS